MKELKLAELKDIDVKDKIYSNSTTNKLVPIYNPKNVPKGSKDTDGDGVVDLLDCDPLDKNKDGFWNKAKNWATGKGFQEEPEQKTQQPQPIQQKTPEGSVNYPPTDSQSKSFVGPPAPKKVAVVKNAPRVLNPNREPDAIEKGADFITKMDKEHSRRVEKMEEPFRKIPGLKGDSYIQKFTRDVLALPGRATVGLAGTVLLGAGKATLIGAALTTDKYRETTKEEMVRAAKATPKAIAQSYDPRKPEGLVNILATVGMVKMVGGARAGARGNVPAKGTATKPLTSKTSVTKTKINTVETGKFVNTKGTTMKYDVKSSLSKSSGKGQYTLHIRDAKGKLVKTSRGKFTEKTAVTQKVGPKGQPIESTYDFKTTTTTTPARRFASKVDARKGTVTQTGVSKKGPVVSGTELTQYKTTTYTKGKLGTVSPKKTISQTTGVSKVININKHLMKTDIKTSTNVVKPIKVVKPSRSISLWPRGKRASYIGTRPRDSGLGTGGSGAIPKPTTVFKPAGKSTYSYKPTITTPGSTFFTRGGTAVSLITGIGLAGGAFVNALPGGIAGKPKALDDGVPVIDEKVIPETIDDTVPIIDDDTDTDPEPKDDVVPDIDVTPEPTPEDIVDDYVGGGTGAGVGIISAIGGKTIGGIPFWGSLKGGNAYLPRGNKRGRRTNVVSNKLWDMTKAFKGMKQYNPLESITKGGAASDLMAPNAKFDKPRQQANPFVTGSLPKTNIVTQQFKPQTLGYRKPVDDVSQYIGKTANKGFGNLKTKAQKNEQLFGKKKKKRWSLGI